MARPTTSTSARARSIRFHNRSWRRSRRQPSSSSRWRRDCWARAPRTAQSAAPATRWHQRRLFGVCRARDARHLHLLGVRPALGTRNEHAAPRRRFLTSATNPRASRRPLRSASSANRSSARSAHPARYLRRSGGQRLSERARSPARRRESGQHVRIRVLRDGRSDDQRVRAARRFIARQHGADPARRRANPSSRAVLAHEISHVTQHHFTRSMAAQQRSLLLTRSARWRSRSPRPEPGGSHLRPGRRGGVIRGAGARDPIAAQLHARERIRGRSHRFPARSRPPSSMSTRWRRSWNGCSGRAASPKATRRRTCARTR